MRKKAALDEQVPFLIDTDIDSKEFRKSWSRLIQKIYIRYPLVCPKCNGKMKVIALNPEPDNHHNNRYEDDYSQLPDEELCLKQASSR